MASAWLASTRAVVRKMVFTDLLNEVNRWLKIQAKVNELPVDALTTILVLLQDEHRVVEQLLKLFVCVVDAQLFEGVELQRIQQSNYRHQTPPPIQCCPLAS